MPMLLLILAMAVEIAAVEMTSLRLRSAVDLAGVDAASMVDANYYARTGLLRLDVVRARVVARDFLDRNLRAVRGAGALADQVAADAEIIVINDVPARDPFSGTLLDRPAICIRARLPVSAGLLRMVGAPAVLSVSAESAAELRT